MWVITLCANFIFYLTSSNALKLKKRRKDNRDRSIDDDDDDDDDGDDECNEDDDNDNNDGDNNHDWNKQILVKSFMPRTVQVEISLRPTHSKISVQNWLWW